MVLVLLVTLLSKHRLWFIFLTILVEIEILFNLEVRQSEFTRIDRDIEAIICPLITVIIGQLSLTRIILFEHDLIGTIRSRIFILSWHDHAEVERTPSSQSLWMYTLFSTTQLHYLLDNVKSKSDAFIIQLGCPLKFTKPSK